MNAVKRISIITSCILIPLTMGLYKLSLRLSTPLDVLLSSHSGCCKNETLHIKLTLHSIMSLSMTTSSRELQTGQHCLSSWVDSTYAKSDLPGVVDEPLEGGKGSNHGNTDWKSVPQPSKADVSIDATHGSNGTLPGCVLLSESDA